MTDKEFEQTVIDKLDEIIKILKEKKETRVVASKPAPPTTVTHVSGSKAAIQKAISVLQGAL